MDSLSDDVFDYQTISQLNIHAETETEKRKQKEEKIKTDTIEHFDKMNKTVYPKLSVKNSAKQTIEKTVFLVEENYNDDNDAKEQDTQDVIISDNSNTYDTSVNLPISPTNSYLDKPDSDHISQPKFNPTTDYLKSKAKSVWSFAVNQFKSLKVAVQHPDNQQKMVSLSKTLSKSLVLSAKVLAEVGKLTVVNMMNFVNDIKSVDFRNEYKMIFEHDDAVFRNNVLKCRQFNSQLNESLKMIKLNYTKGMPDIDMLSNQSSRFVDLYAQHIDAFGLMLKEVQMHSEATSKFSNNQQPDSQNTKSNLTFDTNTNKEKHTQAAKHKNPSTSVNTVPSSDMEVCDYATMREINNSSNSHTSNDPEDSNNSDDSEESKNLPRRWSSALYPPIKKNRTVKHKLEEGDAFRPRVQIRQRY